MSARDKVVAHVTDVADDLSDAVRERRRRHRPWPVRAVKWLLLISALAMGVAAATSQSDVGIRSDGSKSPSDSEDVAGDPKAQPQQDQAAETDNPTG